MAETVRSLRIQVKITGVVVGDDGAELRINEEYDETFGEGTGSDQVGSVWQDKTRSLATTVEDLDVNGGLTDFQGAAMALNNMKVLYVRNLTETAGDFAWVGGDANSVPFMEAVGDRIKVGPKGILLLVSPVDGHVVTAATGDIVQVESVDNISYRAIIAGDNA